MSRHPTAEDFRARNARWDFYQAERIRKGRPKWRTVTRQWRPDANHYPLVDTVAPDPILDLLVARSWAVRAPADPRAQQRYGEIRQLVVSPLDRSLP